VKVEARQNEFECRRILIVEEGNRGGRGGKREKSERAAERASD
jgi:hypothetical protein